MVHTGYVIIKLQTRKGGGSMDTFYVLFGMVLLFAALLIPGYILGKTKAITDAAVTAFGNILMYIAMPFLVFTKLLEIDLSQIGMSEILISAFLPVGLELILILLCRVLYRGNPADNRAAVFCAVFPNCGFLGIPLAAAMWPALPEIVLYISIFNVISTFMLLTVGVFLLSGDRKALRLKKTLISPIFFAILAGVAASLLHVKEHFSWAYTYAQNLAQLTTPLAMISLGYELSKLHILKMWLDIRVYFTALTKLILSPLLAIGILAVLQYVVRLEITPSVVFAMLTATAVSTAASAPAMAKKYGLDSAHAAALTLTNTLLCVVTLPMMYLLSEAIFSR